VRWLRSPRATTEAGKPPPGDASVLAAGRRSTTSSIGCSIASTSRWDPHATWR
jgi:hypothetical protein